MSNKEKIIQSALELFAKNGYTETSIDKIAKHAGVSKGLTYTHFENKEELLLVTIEETIRQLATGMLDVEELNFKNFFEEYFNTLRVNTHLIRLCLLLVIHPQTPSNIFKILNEQKKGFSTILVSLLQNQFNENAENEAEILGATFDGITIAYVTNPNLINLEIIQQYLTDKYYLA